jgi:dihydroorotase-like cyclic amidohydrolase
VIDRTIEAVADRIDRTADLEIDGRGLTLLPGVIDPQGHFREPGLEHNEDLFTVSCACTKGGVTSSSSSGNAQHQAPDNHLGSPGWHQDLHGFGPR